MDNVLSAEILKTRKRWLPYGLFVMCLIGVAFLIFPAGYLEWHNNRTSEALRTFAFPYSIPALLDSGQFWGSMFTGVIAASVVATEHNWATVRQALVRGQTRFQYLLVKLAGISMICAAMLLGALLIGVLISLYATELADRPITLDVPGGPSVLDIVVMILRAGFCVLPYGMLAFMLATVSRSSTLGITGIVIFLFGEAIAIAILDSIGGIAPDLNSLSIGENVKAVLAVNRIAGLTYNSMAPREQASISDLADPNVAALILLAHTALYATLAFWIFNRRDV